MTMIWHRKKSIQLVSSAWKTTSRFITCNRAMTCQGQWLAAELGHSWFLFCCHQQLCSIWCPPFWADLHWLKENMSRTSSSFSHWILHTVPSTPTTLTHLCFQIFQDYCTYPGLCTHCTFCSSCTQPLTTWTFCVQVPSLPLLPGDYLLIFYDSSPGSTPLCSLPDHPLEESTTSFFGPLMYPEWTSLITPMPLSSYLDDFWA